MDGDAGVGHRLVGERLDLGDAAQVDDGAHAPLLDQVHDVGGGGVRERIAAEHAVAAGDTGGRGVPPEVAEVHQPRDLGTRKVGHRRRLFVTVGGTAPEVRAK